MAIEPNLNRTKEYVKKKKISGRAFVQGLIGAGIFLISLLVVFLAYVPLIKEANGFIDQRKELEIEIEALNIKYKTINEYGSAKLTSQLAAVEYFIPDDMRVAELATFINTEATKYKLTVTRLGISEDKTEVNKTTNDEKEKLIGTSRAVDKVYLGRIEGPFTFSGTRNDIFDFLDFLVKGGYATNFDKVSIVSQSDNADKEDKDGQDVWSVSFFTAYYYLQPIVDLDPKTPLLKINENVLEPVTFLENTQTDLVVPSEEILNEEDAIVDSEEEISIPTPSIVEE